MNKDKTRTQSKSPLTRWFILAICGVLAVVGIIIVMLMTQSTKQVSNFEQCKTAGGVVLESYPEQCTINGKTFTNTTQSVDGNGYIGMSEADALAKAKQDNVAAELSSATAKVYQ